MLSDENCSPTELSIETGISKSTLATWKSKTLGKDIRKKTSKSLTSYFLQFNILNL